jgi:hypothetical protein
VPQEEDSPSMYIAQVVYKYQRGNHSKYHHCRHVVSWLTPQKQNSHIVMQQPDN